MSVLGALPFASISVNLWETSTTFESAFMILHILTGIFGGLGYSALIAMLATVMKRGWPRITFALSSVGKRSLTFYIYQESLLVIWLAQVGLGWGSTFGYTGALVTALIIWGSGCLLAVWFEKMNKRGPVETLLRKLVYKNRD